MNIFLLKDFQLKEIFLSVLLCLTTFFSVVAQVIVPPANIIHVVIYGQSLALGTRSYPVFSTTQKYNTFMFEGGVRSGYDTDPTIFYNSLVPLVEKEVVSQNSGGILGETPASGFSESFVNLLKKENGFVFNEASKTFTGYDFALLISAPAEGSKSVKDLSSGIYWERFKKDIAEGKRMATATGKTYNVPVILWNQGERDIDLKTNPDKYKQALTEFHQMADEYIKSVTGQSNTVTIILYQTSSHHKRLNGEGEAFIANAQYELAKTESYITMSSATYQLPYANDDVHFSNVGSKWNGAYHAVAAKRITIDHTGWKPIYVKNATYEDNIIHLDFHVPVPPLVLDETAVSNPGNHGFKVFNRQGAEVNIAKVQLAGDKLVDITLTDNVSEGYTVWYGNNGTGTGATNGARGNLRDSQGEELKIEINSVEKRLDNWCPIFKEMISNNTLTYQSPQVYQKDIPVVPLFPISTGIALPLETLGETKTIAGNGTATSEDGDRLSASFNFPSGIATDAGGNIFVADFVGNRIRKIDAQGIVSTFAGNDLSGSTDAVGGAASFKNPYGIAIDNEDNLYVADRTNHKIRKITPSGTVTTLAGSGVAGAADGLGENASFNQPHAVAADLNGNVYVADRLNHKIRKIIPLGMVTTIAGTGTAGSSDNNVGLLAEFNNPIGVAVDNSGNVYIADNSSRKIRKISIEGAVTTLAGSGVSGSKDGYATEATFQNPNGIALDEFGNIYVADVGANANKIRKITPSGMVTTLAGNGTAGYNDNTIGSEASFNGPSALAINKSGNLFIADRSNHRIRQVVTTGYSIKPELPEGLNFNRVDGSITGTPSVEVTPKNYTITAYYPNGNSSSSILNLAVLGILPIKFISLSAKLVLSTVKLKWQTTGQKDISNFIVEHAAHGLPFTEITSLNPSKNNLGAKSNYEYTHLAPFTGSNYYRIKVCYYDGTFDYSAVKVVRMEQRNVLRVYPNPASQHVTIDHSPFSNVQMQICLVDTFGKTIKVKHTKNNNTQTEIRLPQLPSGVYNIICNYESGYLSQKIVINQY